MPAEASLHPAPRRRWHFAWITAVLAIITLPTAWYWWSHERLSARQLQQTLQREAAVAPLEDRVAARLSGWKAAHANVAGVQEKIKSRGETPEQWPQRTLTIDNQRMSRMEAEQYLADLTNDDQNLFVPTVVNIRAAKSGESVFTSHQGQDSDNALVLTIKADLYTRGAR